MAAAHIGTPENIRLLLGEGIAAALEREKSTFDRMTAPFGRSLVLFGAGGIGRKTLAGLRKIGIEPLLFADNDPTLWGKQVDGLSVVSPQEASSRHGRSAAFVVTIWRGEGQNKMGERLGLLHELGCERVVTFGPLFWKYPKLFLPHYAAAPAHEVHEQAVAVLEAASLWEDDASRSEYESQVRWRLYFDFDKLADPVSHPIYFPSDICPLIPDEVFVDCGAYDGDTVMSFLDQVQSGFRKIVAFEPDPETFGKLGRLITSLPSGRSIELHQAAAGAVNGAVRFSGGGKSSASVGSGTLEVNSVKLDDTLKGTAPTYIKMDIEGAELDAISGARRIIEEHSPVLAICSYHRQDHLWNIPRLINKFNPDYHFFLRPHLLEVWDLVCYAIPTHRLKRARTGQ
jgi:FkbM family methyltransferase